MTTFNSKCNKYSVDIMENGKNGEYGYIAIANQNTFDSETMSNTSYWFGIGHYKTMKNAIRQSIKRMATFNIELNID